MNAASFAEGLDACTNPQVAGLKACLIQDMVHPKSVLETHPDWVVTKAKKNIAKKLSLRD